MWNFLNNGEPVFVGDTIRYRLRSNSQPLAHEQFVVVKIEQHYFEIIRKSDDPDESESLGRKVVRFIDIGYNILLERWGDR